MVTGAAKAEAELCLRWGKAEGPAKAEAELCLRCEKAEVIFPGRRQARGNGGVRPHRAAGDDIALLGGERTSDCESSWDRGRAGDGYGLERTGGGNLERGRRRRPAKGVAPATWTGGGDLDLRRRQDLNLNPVVPFLGCNYFNSEDVYVK